MRKRGKLCQANNRSRDQGGRAEENGQNPCQKGIIIVPQGSGLSTEVLRQGKGEKGGKGETGLSGCTENLVEINNVNSYKQGVFKKPPGKQKHLQRT